MNCMFSVLLNHLYILDFFLNHFNDNFIHLSFLFYFPQLTSCMERQTFSSVAFNQSLVVVGLVSHNENKEETQRFTTQLKKHTGLHTLTRFVCVRAVPAMRSGM